MTQLMNRQRCKDMKELPGVIGKWELEVKQYQQRSGKAFPEEMRMPIFFVRRCQKHGTRKSRPNSA